MFVIYVGAVSHVPIMSNSISRFTPHTGKRTCVAFAGRSFTSRKSSAVTCDAMTSTRSTCAASVGRAFRNRKNSRNTSDSTTSRQTSDRAPKVRMGSPALVPSQKKATATGWVAPASASRRYLRSATKSFKLPIVKTKTAVRRMLTPSKVQNSITLRLPRKLVPKKRVTPPSYRSLQGTLW